MTENTDLNWDDLRYLLAAARAGSCAAASRQLGVAVSTVTRRLNALQQAVGRPLVILNTDGLLLTQDGEAMVEDARKVEEAFASLQRRLSEDARIAGQVRLSAVGTIASEFLAPAAGDFCARFPTIELTLVGETQMVDVLRGEADIVVRLSRPRQDRLISRQITTIPMGIYASRAYVDAHGMPEDAAATLAGHRLVALVREFDNLPMSRWLIERCDPAQIVFRGSQTVMCERAIRAGAGIGILPVVMADGLVEVARPDDLAPEPVWIGYHEDVRRVPRIRAVVDWVIETLAVAIDGNE